MGGLLLKLTALLFSAICCLPSPAAKLELQSNTKIWDKGNHNAFTDLIRYKGRFYCTFRESEAHVGGNGKLRVLESKDGSKWESAALIEETGIDLRDPKLSITGDGRLMMVAGGSIYEGTRVLKGKQPRVLFSKDGKQWTPPQKVLTDGEWLWRVTWFKGHAYGVSYNSSPANKVNWIVTLFDSADGISWNKLTTLDVPGHPNESTLRFLKNGNAMLLMRRDGPENKARIGVSKPPYTNWQWTSANHSIGGPNFIILKDGRRIAAGRDSRQVPKYSTAVGFLTEDGYTPELTLPSSGDTSYPGMVWYKGMLWMSYYSSHEGKTSIYLAKIKLNP